MLEAKDLFSEVAILLFTASLLGILAVRFKQPLIVGYIAVGILLGPSTLGWVETNDQIDLMAKLGISLLLFIVGLKLDLNIIRTMGPVALATGIGQVVFTSLFGYAIALGLDFSHIESIYIAVALTFSSTIIIVKLLSDKREVDSLHGRIAIGFLIVQDMLVILAMIVLNALSGAQNETEFGPKAFTILINGIAFVVAVGFLMKYLLTPLLDSLAESKELLMLFSIAWAVSLAALGYYLGFSKEVGAFIAGVSLASTPYRDVIGARLVSLRDFLLIFFFVDLGASLDLSVVGHQFDSAVVLSLFVIIGNPIIVMVIMGLMGYRKRTGFLAGLTVAQISEFSLILGALGVSLGHISGQVMGLITMVGLITISVSTYMILYSHLLYQKLLPLLAIFEKEDPSREQIALVKSEIETYDIIVFGLGRFGRTIIEELKKNNYTALGVDFNPEVVKRAKKSGLVSYYGDAEDEEFISTLPLHKAKWIVGAIHDKHVNHELAHILDKVGYTGLLALTENNRDNEVSDASNNSITIIPLEYAAIYAAQVLQKLQIDHSKDEK